MSDSPALTASDERSRPPAGAAWPIRAVLGAAMVALVYGIGGEQLDAPWIQGDEQIFIAQNADVTGADGRPLAARVLGLFGKIHEDLYQPVPLATYALEWALWGPQRVAFMRQTDVLLHALNALLFWLVASALLRRTAPGSPPRQVQLTSWALALLWAVHPMLVSAYAADMGRTHVLAATFALLAALLHIRSCDADRRTPFWAVLVLLAGAMMCKTLPGWFVVVFAVEAALRGARTALRSWRVYAATALCLGFAALNFLATRRSGIIEDAELALFGDRFSRSLLAVWIYFRNLFAPLDLSIWYPPDIRTSWSYRGVWLGAAIVLALLLVLAWGARRRSAAIALGIAWFLATIVPVLGLVGARVSAAQDRYMYLPLMGLLIALGAAVVRLLREPAARLGVRTYAPVAALVLAAIAVAPAARSLCGDCRTTIRRADRSLRHHAGDPRALEFSAAALAFSAGHDTLEGRAVRRPNFADLAVARLLQAAGAAEESPHYFRDQADRAAFHRRLSFHLLNAGNYEESLQQAQRAEAFQPDSPVTHMRLAHAYRALGDWDRALQAYGRLEQHMPDDVTFRALRLTEIGDLLLHIYERPDLAKPKYEAALATGVTLPRAGVGLARCEVLVGDGAAGFEVAGEVLRADPDNLDAALVVALYHLRSHHWPQAEGAYAAILRRYPTDFEALRGYHEVCGQLDKWNDAAFMWQRAVDAAPDHPAFRGFLAWAAACAGQQGAESIARSLLDVEPRNRFARLAMMLLTLRNGDTEQALRHAAEVENTDSQPDSRELERADATLRLLAEREQVGPDGLLLRAVLAKSAGRPEVAAELAREYLAAQPESPHRAIAEAVAGAVSIAPDVRDGKSP